jgi:hypothetical protein
VNTWTAAFLKLRTRATLVSAKQKRLRLLIELLHSATEHFNGVRTRYIPGEAFPCAFAGLRLMRRNADADHHSAAAIHIEQFRRLSTFLRHK